jgi:hypothetical protein
MFALLSAILAEKKVSITEKEIETSVFYYLKMFHD